MMRYLFIFTFGTFFLYCSSKIEKSAIELIQYDTAVVSDIQSNYDSTYTEYTMRDDFWTVDYYLVDTIYENFIYKDSLQNIVGIVKRQNGQNIYLAEYYPNGQLMGKLTYSSPGLLDGIAKYYYEDGRIKSFGEWKNFKMVGEWKNYDKNGLLKSIDLYVDGKLESTSEMSN